MNKHAFLIGAYKNPDYLLELIDSLDSPRSNFYIHVNLYNDNEFDTFKKKIEHRDNIHYFSCVKINYGGSDFFNSQMILCNESLKEEENQYFHFITGQDVLCQPLESFMEFVEKENKNFIQYIPLPSKWEYRYSCFGLWDILNFRTSIFLRAFNRLFIIVQQLLHIKRSNLGFNQLYCGSGWWSIRKDACQYVVSKWNNNTRLHKRLRNTFAPDEMFFQTVLLNAEETFPIVNDNLRYIRWVGKTSPKTLTLQDYDDVINSGKFIARKVEPLESAELIKKLHDFTNK